MANSFRLTTLALAATSACATGSSSAAPAPAVPTHATAPARPAAAAPSAERAAKTDSPTPTGHVLILYDHSGAYAWLTELYAIAVANLVSHFDTWEAQPVAGYTSGRLADYRAAIYVGTAHDEPLPPPFLADVLGGVRPVLWINDNIAQLASRPGFESRYGFRPSRFDDATVQEVRYKGATLRRTAEDQNGIMAYDHLDPARTQVLATAVSKDGRSIPWALRSRNLTYVGEIPFAFISEEDRYLAFCDLLFDLLAPETIERHRALVRIEDVNALTPPAQLRAIADVLAARHVPFSVAVVPIYADPLGQAGARRVPLNKSRGVVSALRYMVSRGATLVMHGCTHQYGATRNPYNGQSVSDFEFYRAHIDEADHVVLDGPVPEDSAAWASARAEEGLSVFRAAKLPVPSIFEYPHYAGSAVDSQALSQSFPMAYQRGMYFAGSLSGATDPDPNHSIGLFYPFVIKDVFGWKILPENLGNYIAVGYNGNPSRGVDQIVQSARTNRVVRDGFASFFFHPMYATSLLREIVSGIQAEGYTFVDPSSL